jgi:hypothetical protein
MGNRRRATAEEIEQRAAYCADLLAQGAYKHEAFRLLKKRYDISTSVCNRVLTRARELLADRAGGPREQHRQDSMAFYLWVVRSPRATIREKMEARGRIEKLLGLRAPLMVAATDAEGNDVFQQGREWVKAAMRTPEGADLLCRLSELTCGAGGGTPGPELSAEYGLRELPRRNGVSGGK